MANSTVFLSFTRIPNSLDHRAYNTWHQLDHRPENLALPGVRYGERWVHGPRCAETAMTADAPLDRLHYLNAYWFEEPAEASIRTWQHLAEESLDQGRRPDLGLAERLVMGFFDQTQVCVSPNLPISAEALPLRPSRGIHLTVDEVADPRSSEAEAHNRWDREVRVPRIAQVRGVAGVCVLTSTSTTLDPIAEGGQRSSTLLVSPGAVRGRLRITVSFLEDSPLELERKIDEASQARSDQAGEGRRTLFRGVLQSIVPWEWDWFDDATKAQEKI